eukprot:3251220-Pleurochrysis_carterae.AAC.4
MEQSFERNSGAYMPPRKGPRLCTPQNECGALTARVHAFWEPWNQNFKGVVDKSLVVRHLRRVLVMTALGILPEDFILTSNN